MPKAVHFDFVVRGTPQQAAEKRAEPLVEQLHTILGQAEPATEAEEQRSTSTAAAHRARQAER